MSTPIPNLGTSRRIKIYVEGKLIGRDFKQMKSFNANPTYAEGKDEYLGTDLEIPWQRCNGAQGDFEIEESDGDYINQLQFALLEAEREGQRPDVLIVEEIASNSGTFSKIEYPNSVLKPSTKVAGKNEKVMRAYTFTSSKPSLG